MAKWQNLSSRFYSGIGQYEVPEMLPVIEMPDVKEWIEFDYCKRTRKKRESVGVHFFEDDYKFERVWESSDRYGEMLSDFGCILSPDFSQYIDFPKAIQIYNHYRNCWLARYWAEFWGITVIPTVMWGTKDTYDWCFDGFPKNSIVAVSTVGLFGKWGNDKEMQKLFIDGYNEMLRRLEPSKILVFSRTFKQLPGNTQFIRWNWYKGEQI